jgi:hypothetical protein
MQRVRCVRALALDSAGKSMLAKMAMIAITTSNSIKVKPRVRVTTQLRSDTLNFIPRDVWVLAVHHFGSATSRMSTLGEANPALCQSDVEAVPGTKLLRPDEKTQ